MNLGKKLKLLAIILGQEGRGYFIWYYFDIM